MQPPISTGDEPPFYKLDEYRFQKLCRDLHAKEPGIALAQVYGVRGERQEGIDVRAQRLGTNEIEVGQCKRYETFSSADIQAASDEFFKYWDYWKTQEVKRFILFVTVELSSQRQIETLDKERKRFRSYGIEYEHWGSDMIRNKLREHSGIVATYVDEPDYWVKKICGAINPGSWRNFAAQTKVSSDYQEEQIEALAASWSAEVERRLDEIREDWRGGQKDAARLWLYQIKSDHAVWPHIRPAVKAKVLRFEARVTLDLTGNTYESTRLIAEAHTLAPDTSDQVIRALIAHREHDIERALQLIAGNNRLEGANLQAALLLETDRIDEAKSVLDQAGKVFSPNADTFRILAFLNLVRGDIDEARQMVQRASIMAPRWESVRWANALINYYSVFSPRLIGGFIPALPEPVNWAFVKQDDASRTHLRAAALAFGELAEEAYDSVTKRRYLIWYMAALANDLDTEAEAVSLCQNLLKDSPRDGLLIHWAMIRGYDIELEEIEKSIERRMRSDKASLQDILVLLQCRIAQNQITRAINLLNRSRPLFEQHQDLWATKLLQLRILKGERRAIADALGATEETKTSLEIKAVAFRVSAKRSGVWQPLRDHLAHCFATTGAVEYLLELCELLVFQHQWDELAGRADQLVTTIETPIAIQLSTLGFFNSHRYEDCLSLLDERKNIFRASQLPQELQRMRALCLLKLGALSEAVKEAAHLVQRASTVENLLTLIDIHIDLGDLMQAAVVARELRDHSDLPVAQALRLAALIHSEDLPLAQAFWHQAVSQAIDDDMVGAAYGLGMRLKLDRELHELTIRLTELAASGRGGIKAFSIPDLLQFAQQRHQDHVELEALYRHGDAPIHVVAELLGISLFDLYHRELTLKETAPRSWVYRPLMARHGSRLFRPINIEPISVIKRLHLDITALLLAAHLELLDVIEQTFKQLYIPVGLVPSLLTLRDQLPHHQPSRLDISQRIVALVRQRRLQVLSKSPQGIVLDAELAKELGDSWAMLHAQARKSGGYIVDFLPITKHDPNSTPVVLQEEVALYITNCRGVIDALKMHGKISEAMYVKAINALGGEAHRVTDAPTPVPGRALFCNANIPNVLFDADVLDIVTTHFRVYIEQDEYEQATGTLHYADLQQEGVVWLDNLIGRVRRGLETGLYQRIAETVVEQEDAADNRGTPLARCLTSLFAFPVQEGDAIWIDDRFANTYIHRDTAPILDIVDVLRLLVGAGTLAVDRYYEVLIRLRAAEVRFIAIDSDEIAYALGNSRVDEQGNVLESSHLMNLRQYIARCLLQRDTLQWPPLPERTPPYPSPDGEVAFVFGLQHVLDETLVAIWSSEDDFELCRAKATWLVDNLMFDPLMGRAVLGFPSDDDQKRLSLASQLAELIVRVWGITRDTPEATEQARDAYEEWLEWRLINPRIIEEPLLASMIADLLKEITGNALDNPPDDIPVQILEVLFHSLLEWVPIVVGDELKRDPIFLERLGVTVQTRVRFGGLLFDPDVAWPALETVINGEPARITPVNSEHVVLFEPALDGTDALVIFEHPITHEQYRLNDSALYLLSHTPPVREEILRQNRFWFDCSNEIFEHILVEIVTQPNPRQRVHSVERWRNENMAGYYAMLEQQFQSQQLFRLEDFRPASAEGLLRHFRLIPTGEMLSIRDMLTSAAPMLIQELGLEEAIDRLVRLPIPLPAMLIEAVMALSTQEQRNLVRQLLSLCDSPLAIFHLLRLLTQLGEQIPAFRRLARRLVARLIGAQHNGTFTAYFAMLGWVHELFGVWGATEAWTPELRVAMVWAHTDKVFRVLVSMGSSSDWLIQTFRAGLGKFVNELLHHDPHIWFDVAHPRRQHSLRFLIAGLSYGLAESTEAILDNRLYEQLFTSIFPDSDGTQLPSTALFADSLQASNLLSSFLGQDHAEQIAHLLGDKAAALFTRSTVNKFIREVIDLLQTSPDNPQAWVFLNSALAGQPPAQELRDEILALFRQLYLVGLYQTSPVSGTLALRTVARHVMGLNDSDLGMHLTSQLAGIAHMLTEAHSEGTLPVMDGEADSAHYYVHQLLEACIYLVIAAYPDQPTALVYSDILQQIIDANPLAATICAPFVGGLCNSLPIAEAQYFWSLLIRLRAE